MKLSVTPKPAPGWLRELADARATYQELLGWPVSVQVGRRSLVVAVGSALAAVAMPAALGARVRAQLGISILSAPIVANPDGTRWTFLARPDEPVRPAVVEDLAAAGVRVAPEGSYVVLPTTLDRSSGPAERWIDEPRPNRILPPLHAIIALARRLTYRELPRTA
ncbi:MAG TPA: hypothetical protein VGX25_32265 [Actinophytocola sp.]|uniref:hypothetical protein n=1 Tax=Actinophytocola sp. TaxID=1872138 RepID=UPI002DDD24EF|nr:hypothetical protein [Actinophytocola sp.]HEV2784087.1 hypothetical protein [Actinophytocola sp.]